MRLFISIDVDHEPVRSQLMNVVNRLDAFDGVTPVPPENLHITVLFLGDRSRETARELRQTFTAASRDIPVHSFDCTASDLGVFPHMNFIQVVWAGTGPVTDIHMLHEYFSERMNVDEEKDFVPHITLARVKHVSNREKQAIQRLVREGCDEFGTFPVTDVRLKQSRPGEHEPVYQDLEVCDLAGAG